MDKSLFIQEILDAVDEVTLITRPRRFGKTLNLDMLHCFLQYPADSDDDVFKGLAIEKAGEKYAQERGKRPVLFVTFKNIKGSNWNNAWVLMQDLLAHFRSVSISSWFFCQQGHPGVL